MRWEQEIRRKLFSNDVYFSEFQVDGLLRGDAKTRYDGYRIARETGWLSVNEIRALENLEPVDGGDQYIQPLNMGTVVGEVVEDDEARDWAVPLLEDALFRAKRLQDNGERQAKRRKGDHYGEWRNQWLVSELPPLVEEIIAPAIEAIYISNKAPDEGDMFDKIGSISRRAIVTSQSVEEFTKTIIGEMSNV